MLDFLKKQQLTNAQIAELLVDAQTLYAKKNTILLKEKEKANRIFLLKKVFYVLVFTTTNQKVGHIVSIHPKGYDGQVFQPIVCCECLLTILSKY